MAAKRRRLKNASTYVKQVVEKELKSNRESKTLISDEDCVIEEVLPGDPDWDMAQKLLKRPKEWVKFSTLVDNISEIATRKFSHKKLPSVRKQLEDL